MGTMFNPESVDGTWFEFQESKIGPDNEPVFSDPEPDAARFCIRSIAPMIEDRIAGMKQKKQVVHNPKTRAMEIVFVPEEITQDERKAMNADMYDYAIVDWDGVLDASGVEIECTRENKLRLMRVPKVDRFVGWCLRLVGDLDAKSENKAVENL